MKITLLLLPLIFLSGCVPSIRGMNPSKIAPGTVITVVVPERGARNPTIQAGVPCCGGGAYHASIYNAVVLSYAAAAGLAETSATSVQRILDSNFRNFDLNKIIATNVKNYFVKSQLAVDLRERTLPRQFAASKDSKGRIQREFDFADWYRSPQMRISSSKEFSDSKFILEVVIPRVTVTTSRLDKVIFHRIDAYIGLRFIEVINDQIVASSSVSGSSTISRPLEDGEEKSLDSSEVRNDIATIRLHIEDLITKLSEKAILEMAM